MKCSNSYQKEIVLLKSVYDKCIKDINEGVNDDLPFLRLFVDSLQLPRKTDREVIELFSKFEFLSICRINSKTKNISPLIVLQYFDVRFCQGC